MYQVSGAANAHEGVTREVSGRKERSRKIPYQSSSIGPLKKTPFPERNNTETSPSVRVSWGIGLKADWLASTVPLNIEDRIEL